MTSVTLNRTGHNDDDDNKNDDDDYYEEWQWWWTGESVTLNIETLDDNDENDNAEDNKENNNNNDRQTICEQLSIYDEKYNVFKVTEWDRHLVYACVENIQ